MHATPEDHTFVAAFGDSHRQNLLLQNRGFASNGPK